MPLLCLSIWRLQTPAHEALTLLLHFKLLQLHTSHKLFSLRCGCAFTLLHANLLWFGCMVVANSVRLLQRSKGRERREKP